MSRPTLRCRRPVSRRLVVAAMLLVATAGLAITGSSSVAATPADACAPSDLVMAVPASFSFAVIGDYGDTPAAGRVASLVTSWLPAFVATVGDNAYDADAPSNGSGGFVWAGSVLDRSVGQWFSSYIGDYRGAYGGGPAPGRASRFFPALGNHDWDGAPGGGVWVNLPYRSYFALPGIERYYSVRAGLVELFVLDSEPRAPGTSGRFEPDGVGATSVQATWLRAHLADSSATYKIVLMHHPPYTSGPRGSNVVVQWPFAAWGASAVIAGHEHQYERLTGPGGIPYVVSGHGGQPLYASFANDPAPAVSRVQVNDRYGALRVDVRPAGVTIQAFGQPANDPSAPFEVVDQVTVPIASRSVTDPACVPPTTTAPPSPVPVRPIGSGSSSAVADRLGVVP